MNPIEYGSKQAIETCLKVKENEKIVIITDHYSMDIANALKTYSQKKTKLIEFYVLNNHFETPEEKNSFLDQSKKILEALKGANASIYCSSTKPYNNKEPMLFIDELFKVVQENKIRHAHMPSITKEIMETGMCVDYQEVQRITKSIHNILRTSHEAEFTTQKGTYIIAEFSPATRWFLHDGSFDDDIPIENLPSGNLSAPPRNIEGMLVIDGYIGSHLNRKYGDIEKTPITLRIEKNKIIRQSVRCENKLLKKEFDELIFKTCKNTRRIGGVIIGTNIGLDKVIGNLLQDEKLPGLHILFGSPSYFPLNEWSSKVICDCWVKNTALTVKKEKLMDKGVFLI